MTMLPRNMTSPSVAPSAGTGFMVSGSMHGQRLERGIAHALARLELRLLRAVERVPFRHAIR